MHSLMQPPSVCVSDGGKSNLRRETAKKQEREKGMSGVSRASSDVSLCARPAVSVCRLSAEGLKEELESLRLISRAGHFPADDDDDRRDVKRRAPP